MNKIPYNVFLHIGEELCNIDTTNDNNNILHVNTIENEIVMPLTYEHCKKKYKLTIEKFISNNNKHLQQLEKDINDIEIKITEIIRLYSNKKMNINSKFNSNLTSFIYSNKPIVKYLMSLNTLECEKLKYYNLTLNELKEQRDIFVEILKKTISYLNKLLVLDK